MVKYQGLARRYPLPPRFLMRSLLNGGNVGRNGMDDAELSGEFRRVCQIASRIDRDCASIIEFEPQLVQLLKLARQMSRDAAVQCFIEIVRGDLEL